MNRSRLSFPRPRLKCAELSHEALLQLRARVGGHWTSRPASYMTYSRHYPLLERIVDAGAGELAATVKLFRLMDARQPSTVALMKQLSVSNPKDARFLLAHEAAIIEITLRLAAERAIQLH